MLFCVWILLLINSSFIDTSFSLVVGTTSIKNNLIPHSRMSITKWINFKTLELVHATHLPHGIHSVFQAGYIATLKVLLDFLGVQQNTHNTAMTGQEKAMCTCSAFTI